MGSCLCSTSDDKCMTPFGSVSVGDCKSSCMKEVKEDAITLETIIDAKLKEMFHSQVTPAIEAHIGKALADLVEKDIFRVIDIDVIPRDSNASAQEEHKTAPDIVQHAP